MPRRLAPPHMVDVIDVETQIAYRVELDITLQQNLIHRHILNRTYPRDLAAHSVERPDSHKRLNFTPNLPARRHATPRESTDDSPHMERERVATKELAT